MSRTYIHPDSCVVALVESRVNHALPRQDARAGVFVRSGRSSTGAACSSTLFMGWIARECRSNAQTGYWSLLSEANISAADAVSPVPLAAPNGRCSEARI